MNRRINRAIQLEKFVHVLKCPICEREMKVADLKSLICSKNHTFDITKQGYVNLLSRPSSATSYTKELFRARHHVITESNLYQPMHEGIARVIKNHFSDFQGPLFVGDLGCGEGSHLKKIVDQWNDERIIGIGLDLAKEGILLAAKKYSQGIWFVGDLANTPFQDQTLHVILNILSPANYKEFKRILAGNGLVLKVIPRQGYLRELREFLYRDEKKKKYKNEDTETLFMQHFHLKDEIHLCYTKDIQQEELKQLVQMTPLTWSAEKQRIDEYILQDSAPITVDITILVGTPK